MRPTRHTGDRGERLAAVFLRRHGLSVLGRNLEVDGGEIDLLADDGGRRVVVEVRTITGDHDPLAAYGPEKRRRVARLAGRVGADRVDLVAVRLTPSAAEVRWVRGAG